MTCRGSGRARGRLSLPPERCPRRQGPRLATAPPTGRASGPTPRHQRRPTAARCPASAESLQSGQCPDGDECQARMGPRKQEEGTSSAQHTLDDGRRHTLTDASHSSCEQCHEGQRAPERMPEPEDPRKRFVWRRRAGAVRAPTPPPRRSRGDGSFVGESISPRPAPQGRSTEPASASPPTCISRRSLPEGCRTGIRTPRLHRTPAARLRLTADLRDLTRTPGFAPASCPCPMLPSSALHVGWPCRWPSP